MWSVKSIFPILVIAAVMQQWGWRPFVRAAANRLFNSNSFPLTNQHKLTMQKTAVMPKLNFQLSPQQITDTTSVLISEYKQALDKLGSTPVEQCTFENILKPLAMLEGKFSTSLSSLTFPQYVHPDEQVRNACIAAQQAIDQFSIEKGMRQDIFKVVKSVGDRELSKLAGEEKRLVEKMLLDFKLNGLYLNEDQRNILKGYRQELAESELNFSKAVNADKTTVEFSKDELEGCSEAFLSSLEFNKDTHKYVVTMKYPDLLGVLRYAKQEETRRRLVIVDGQRCSENMQELAKAVELRGKAARLLGFKDHTELQLADRMAKTPQAVNTFIADLISKLKPKAEEELKVLKELKKAETGSTDFNSWDFAYYSTQLTQKRYSVDHELIREYFPAEHVGQEMLKIYEQVLGLSFEEVTKDPNSPLWHPEVQLYAVKDGASHKLIGHVYFDLHPRDGKYTHAACFPLQPGYQMDPSERQLPASAMVCNFSKATNQLPSLLKHDEVVTFFHELGHAMHGMCAKTRFSRFHGTNTETDYVEAPSQMLENVPIYI